MRAEYVLLVEYRQGESSNKAARASYGGLLDRLCMSVFPTLVVCVVSLEFVPE
jgi:hypothetical protein